MPTFDKLDPRTRPQKVLVYGAPKSGKSLLVAQLAEHGYTIDWFDFEFGCDVISNLSVEAQSRIMVYSVCDNAVTRNASKLAAEFAAMKVFTVCVEHGDVNCVGCKARKLDMDTYDPREDKGPKHVTVFDTLTQLVTSVDGQLTRKEKFLDWSTITKEDKKEWGHWNVQGLFLNQFLSAVQNSRGKVVCITHETDLDPEKNKRSKIVQPHVGTKNNSKHIAKYFGHVVYCKLKGNKHSVISATTDDMVIVAGSRTNINVGTHPKGLAGCFEDLAKYKPSTPPTAEELEADKIEQEEVAVKDSGSTEQDPNSKVPAEKQLSKMQQMLKDREDKKNAEK